MGHTVDRSITAAKSSSLPCSTTITTLTITYHRDYNLAKLQDHSPGVKGLLATQLRGLAMMVW